MLNDNDQSNLKKSACSFISKAFAFYLELNHLTTGFFAKMFDKNSKMYALLTSDSLSLILNAALLAFIGNIFGGFIGRIAFILVLLNIVTFLVNCSKENCGKK